MGMIKHSQSSQKASLQCLYNISKTKLWMEFSIFEVSYRFLMKVARHVQSTEKGSLLNFSNILIKIIATAFVMQNIQILYWVSVMFVVTYFWVAVVKNGAGLLDHGTLKYGVSQESELIKWTDFLYVDTNLGELT